MLPDILFGPGIMYRGPEDEAWLKYLSRIGEYAHRIDHRFLSEICYEHGQRFNDYFPDFNLDTHKIEIRSVTARQVQRYVRYDENEPVTFWAEQFDQFRAKAHYRYPIFEHMIRNRTWPFPPVVIDNTNGFATSLGMRALGSPWHLVEGTHRVSYLNRMLELGLITPSSQHEIFWLHG